MTNYIELYTALLILAMICFFLIIGYILYKIYTNKRKNEYIEFRFI